MRGQAASRTTPKAHAGEREGHVSPQPGSTVAEGSGESFPERLAVGRRKSAKEKAMNEYSLHGQKSPSWLEREHLTFSPGEGVDPLRQATGSLEDRGVSTRAPGPAPEQGLWVPRSCCCIRRRGF